MSSKNILVTSFGGSWQIVPELIGFLNHTDYPLYKYHPSWADISGQLNEMHIPSVDEVFVIHTDTSIAQNAISILEKWKNQVQGKLPLIKYFSCSNVSELHDPLECRQMTDLIFRTILFAKEQCGSGKLILSLTGGRKNMSADIQWASELFGCHAMIHIADSIEENSLLRENKTELFQDALPPDIVRQLYPMLVFGEKEPHSILAIDSEINHQNFPVTVNKPCVPGTALLDHLTEGLKRSDNLLFNHYQAQYRQSAQSSFYGLQMLGPGKISQLESQFIARNFDNEASDIKWLRSLPKAELHCHLGGVLDCDGMIEVAGVLQSDVTELRKQIPEFDEFLKKISAHITGHNYSELRTLIKESKEKIRIMPGVPEPFGIAGFLIEFEGKSKLLEQLLFDKYADERNFANIGIENYEYLGDLQGSGLLKHPATLGKACELLIQYCRNDNVKYLELRCSPANYTTDNFTIEEVIEAIMDSLKDCDHTKFKLIIIASRHKDKTYIEKHVNYVLENIDNERFMDFFAGFDVAGNESAQTPAQLKEKLSALLRQSVQMTIHAGEGVDVKNVWEAVYELSADRIGHGLTLRDDTRLMKRFTDRRITVEMCPSSNYQIVGFKDFRFKEQVSFPEYPLMNYFNKGIRVTVNTDNPGISRTSLSYELYKAACMTPAGISRWDILKLMRNSFISAFIPFDQKKKLILEVEKILMDILPSNQ